MPQDALAFQHIFSLKGSASQSPCPWCSNCMYRVPYFDDDSGFAHIICPDTSKFTKHTNDTFFMMVNELETIDDKKLLAEKEKKYGLNYQPSELLWCGEVRKHLRFPYIVYWDHMHCLTASGGIAQHMVNQIVLRFSHKLKMPIAAWDDFHRKLQGIQPPLRKDFFQTRIVNRPRANFKAFASDCLAAMDVIGLWLLTVPGMDDCPPLEGEIRCFWHMFTIIQILRRGNIADLPRLKKEIEEHHRLYFKVFPAWFEAQTPLPVAYPGLLGSLAIFD